MVKWAGVSGGATHRAMQDAEDTFLALTQALRRCIEEARQDDVAELICMLGPQPGQMSFDETAPPQRELLEKLLAQIKRRPARLVLEEDAAHLPARPERLRARDATRSPELGVCESEVDAVLGAGGALESSGAFEP